MALMLLASSFHPSSLLPRKPSARGSGCLSWQALNCGKHHTPRTTVSIDSLGAPPHRGSRRDPAVFTRRPSMGRKLYVGNLTYGVTDSALQQMFQAHGT